MFTFPCNVSIILRHLNFESRVEGPSLLQRHKKYISYIFFCDVSSSTYLFFIIIFFTFKSFIHLEFVLVLKGPALFPDGLSFVPTLFIK